MEGQYSVPQMITTEAEQVLHVRIRTISRCLSHKATPDGLMINTRVRLSHVLLSHTETIVPASSSLSASSLLTL